VPDLANTVIGGRYRLERRLGAGGMGEVWAATDTRLGRPVALKILRSSLAADPKVRLRFESEARSAARLHHPNVVAVFDAGTDAGDVEAAQLWLVMERLPGRTLADAMAHGPLSPTEVRSVAADVLSGLSAAHAAKLVHRDVKPSNLLRAADGTWKIADFGIAKPLDDAVDLTATDATIGTPSYLSPEQLEGRPATPASDLWAVGVVLYEALAGRKPFVGDTPFAVAHAVRSGEPQSIAALRPDVDLALSSAITAALAKDPGQRPRDAASMAAMLRGVADPAAAGPATTRIPAATTPTALPPPTPPATVLPPMFAPVQEASPTSGRRLLGWITAGVIVLAAAVLIALLATDSFSNGRSPGATTTTTTTTAPSSSTTARTSPSTTSPGTTTTPASTTTATTNTTTPTSVSTTLPPTSSPTTSATTATSSPRTTNPKTTAPTTKP